MEEGAAVVQRAANEVTRLADAYVAAFLARFPDRAELDGIALERHDRLPDNSSTALDAWHDLEDGWAAAVDRIDAAPLVGRPEWVTLGFLREALEGSRGARICRYELWPVNHLSGWQVNLAQLAEAQPVGSPDARDQALARWSSLPQYLDTEIENARTGLRLGYSTPRRAAELVLQQVDALLESPAEAWPFHDPARRDTSGPFAERWTRLLREEIGPAIERYRSFLRDEYLPHARAAIAIAAHPDGDAAYDAAFRASTTLHRSAAETFELGRQRVEANLAEALDLGHRQLGTSDLASLVGRIRDDPANRFESGGALVDFATAAVDRARTAASGAFSRMPAAGLVIEPYPAHVEREMVDDSYWPAADDGSRPARYLIARYHHAAATRSGAEITAFHEAYPGHHLQVALANENQAAHPIARLVWNDGFVEGWARYAEALAEELGLYSSNYGAAGRRLWPCRGLVADVAIHRFGWSRERAAAYMAESGRVTLDEADATVDRISVWPAQFTAYDTGGMEFFSLRAAAEAALGPRFDLRRFHDAVLGNGAVTLPMLREQVERWLADEARPAP